jgi:hypothetical protein
MAFPRGPLRAPAPVRVRVAVFAVGQRIYAACAGDQSTCVTLTDDADKKQLGTLRDGAEVAVLAWRPGSGGATRYRVRATDASGLEGWLPVGSLRGTAIAAASAPSVPPPPAVPSGPPLGEAAADSGRRFGQRRW